MVARFLPLAGALLVFAIACCWRAWLQRRRHGTWGIVLFRSHRRGQNLRDALLVLLFLLLFGQAVVAAASPDSISHSFLARDATLVVIQRIGAVLLVGGIVFLVIAQLDLGASWRIGIDESASPGLVTGGFYRFCRNPIYLALLVIVAGYALLLPTPLSIGLFVGTLIGVQRQARAEEAFLLARYGESFRDYARRVGRFLPGLGRLQ